MTKLNLLISTVLFASAKAQACTESYDCDDTAFCWSAQCRDTADPAVCKTYRGVDTDDGWQWEYADIFPDDDDYEYDSGEDDIFDFDFEDEEQDVDKKNKVINFMCEEDDINFCSTIEDYGSATVPMTPVPTTPVGQTDCVFTRGDADGGPNSCETFLGDTDSREDCLALVRNTTAAATGATWQDGGKSLGDCYAEYYSTVIKFDTYDDDESYVTCIFDTNTVKLGQCTAASKASVKAAKKAVKNGKKSVALATEAHVKTEAAKAEANACNAYALAHVTKVEAAYTQAKTTKVNKRAAKKDRKKTKKYARKAKKNVNKAIKADTKAVKYLAKLGVTA